MSAGHGEQPVPPEPQYMLVLPVSQVAPWQQPPGQDVPSQTHAPFTQRCPEEQAGPVPHMQLPLLAQVSVAGPQVLQDPPAVPHVVRVCASQMPLLQQPPGQDVGVQVHEPLTHA